MAIIKSIAKVSHSKNGVKAVLEYISRKSEQTYGINCSEDFKLAIKEFGETKKFYQKEEGRQYKHIIQSFKAGEVDREKALEIGVEFCEKAFLGHEVFIATHTDREHIHNHIVINSVNLENGKKYHESRADLYQMKAINNEICLAHGLEIPQKNREKGKIIAWDKNKYIAIQNGITKEKESDSLNLVKAIIKTAQKSKNREEFIKRMEEKGYRTDWEEQRKNITFTVDKKILVGNKDKFRLSTLQKTFNHDILSKEGLENEFLRARERSRTGASRGAGAKETGDSGIEIEYKDVAEFAREFETRGDRKGNFNSVAEEIYRESGRASKGSTERDYRIVQDPTLAHRRVEERKREELASQQRELKKRKPRGNELDL